MPSTKQAKKRKYHHDASSSSSPVASQQSTSPPHKKRKSVSFATSVSYFAEEEKRKQQRREKEKEMRNDDRENDDQHDGQQQKQNGIVTTSSNSTTVEEAILTQTATSSETVESAQDVEAMEMTTVMEASEDDEDALHHAAKMSVDTASARIPSQSMDLTTTITPTEQHNNDDMEMTEVIRTKVNGRQQSLSPSLIDKMMNESPVRSSSHKGGAESSMTNDQLPRDMQLTGDISALRHGVSVHHPSVFDPQIEDDTHSHDEDLMNLFSSPPRRNSPGRRRSATATAAQRFVHTENINVDEISLNQRRAPSPAKPRLTRQKAKHMVHQPDSIKEIDENTHAESHQSPQKVELFPSSQSSSQGESQSQQSIALTTTTETAQPPPSTTASRHSNLSESSRLSFLPGEGNAPKNISVEQFLQLLNIRLGSSANFGMKPRSSMYIPTDNEEDQRLTFEQKVHLQTVTSVHFNVIQEACDELQTMTEEAEKELKQLTNEMNAHNPVIFEQVQQLTHGSNEYRRVRQQLTNLKSYARAKNRHEFLQWKISLEEKKHKLTLEEQQKFIEDQHTIEQETKRVREQLHSLEEEERKLRHQKEILQKKLLKETKKHSALSTGSTQKPSETQVLGLMELMTQNIQSQLIPPDCYRLLYPSLNFSIDVIFRLENAKESHSSVFKVKPSSKSHKTKIVTGSNAFSRFVEHMLSQIPVSKMFERVSTATEFRSTFSVKLHPLLNRLNRLLRTVFDYKKRCPSLQFQYNCSEEDHKEGTTAFRLVLFNHREISRLVVEYTVRASSIQLIDAPRVIEYYCPSSQVRRETNQQSISDDLTQIFDKTSKYAQFERSIEALRKHIFGGEL